MHDHSQYINITSKTLKSFAATIIANFYTDHGESFSAIATKEFKLRLSKGIFTY